LYGGFELSGETRLSGRAVGGIRFFRPTRLGGRDQQAPYGDVNLFYRFSPKTLVIATYTFDLQYSAFETIGAIPTVRYGVAGARLEKVLVRGLELYLWMHHTRFKTDEPVTIEQPSGENVTALRNDTAWDGGADLGYRFHSRLRIGVSATYTHRSSNFSDFGIEGLLVGGTVTYDPNKH
jgi:hypothetical protein